MPGQYFSYLIPILALLAGACLDSSWTVCSDGHICETGRVCDPVNATCSSPDNPCLSRHDGFECGDRSVCRAGACVDSCGDGVLDGTDQCEGHDVPGMTCADVGRYAGNVVCTDCRIDLSACSGACGDGRFDSLYEACDPTDLAATPGASCVALGFDAGRQRCSGDCGLTDDPCIRFGWSFEDPVVDGGAMRDMWGTGDDLFVLVEPGGVVSSAKDWAGVVADGDPIRGRAIWASSSDDIWVIGSSGDGFRHWDGTTWSDVAGPAGTTGLNEIWGSSPSNIFAVGDLGSAVHFDGRTWGTQLTPASTGNLRAIWGVDDDQVYAAGDAGSLIRHDGRAWSAVESGTVEDLIGVWAHSVKEIWTLSATAARRFDGIGWTTMLAVDDSPEGRGWIAGTGPSDVWVSAGSGGTVRHYDGASWSTLLADRSVGPQPLWVDRTTVAVGYQIEGSSQGGVRRWNGAGPGSKLDDFGVWYDAWGLGSDVWIAVGGETPGRALHADGSSFVFNEVLRRVAGFAPDHAYAAGSLGAIYEWNGTDWSLAVPRDGTPIADLWTSGSRDLYAMTEAGLTPSRVRHFDGDRWTELPPIEAPCGPQALRGWASSPDDIFVVGYDLLAHFDGSAWTCLYENHRSQTFRSVWGSGANDVWIFEASSTDAYGARLHHWDGERLRPWDQASWISQVPFFAVGLAGTAADDIFLGTAAHFDGRIWSPIRSSAIDDTLQSVLLALPSRLLLADTYFSSGGLGQFVRTRFWNQRESETGCSDGVDDDADGATDAADEDCAPDRRRDAP